MPDLSSAFRIKGPAIMGDAAANRVVVDRKFRRFGLSFVMMLANRGEDYLVVVLLATAYLVNAGARLMFLR